jgi:hypothetical protein
LPHIQPPEATLFVTFRLDGSLPKPVIEQWRVEKKQLEMTLMRWAGLGLSNNATSARLRYAPRDIHERKLT